jgi:hypothetical protein
MRAIWHVRGRRRNLNSRSSKCRGVANAPARSELQSGAGRAWHAPGPRSNKGWAHLRAAIALTQRELMVPRNTAARPIGFKLPRRAAAARTRSYKRIRRALINRRCGFRYIRIINRQPRNAMLLTKVEPAADSLSKAFIAISTVKGTRAQRCRSLRNARARCPPERTNCSRSRKRCKLSDHRPVWVPQRPWDFDWQDDLACADFSSDFDRLRPAAPRRRGCLRLRSVGRNLR